MNYLLNRLKKQYCKNHQILLFVLIMTCFLSCHFSVYSQQFERNRLISAYIYNFGKHVEWKNETQISEFHLKIISNNAKAISSFNEIGNNRTLKGKKIKISAASTLSNTSNVHLVFVAKDKLDEYVKIFDMVEGKNILLVSDDYPKDNLVMINLIETSDHKLRFEINKSNIINQGITVLPELLLLGGTEIDVAKIYRKSQQSLRSIQKQVQHLQQSEKDLKNDNAERRSDIKKQKTLINTLNEEIELQTSSVKLQQIKIDSLSNASEELLDNIKNTRNT